MNSHAEWEEPLGRFAKSIDLQRTFLALDLDGTALLEDQGKVFISSSVEKAVKAIHDLNIPIAINTLRFPLSVMNTVGKEWYQIAEAPILTVLLNGSVLGYIKVEGEKMRYEEVAAYPMSREELKTLLDGMGQLLKDKIEDIILFYYSRNWQEGETLWTPKAERVPALQKKFVSASRVISGTVEQLAEELFAREICMCSLFIDRPQDTLMAYQHSKRNNFFTAKGVNKAFGLREVANKIGRFPDEALGAGDTEMDSFLSEVGCAVIVGNAKLSYRGRKETIRVASPLDLGNLVLGFANLLQANIPG
jgi:hydroxymethylpyrimidine pyrophosphatase-like HAD family hydrolase